MFSDANKSATHQATGRPERRKDFVKRSLVDAAMAARRANDVPALAKTLIEAGRLERSRHRLEAARRCYEEAAALYRQLQEPLRLAHTVRHLGDILQDAGQLVAAEACYTEALAIYRDQPETSPLDLANAIRGFALLQGECGDVEEALALWREARELYAAVNVLAGVEDCDQQIGRLSRFA